MLHNYFGELQYRNTKKKKTYYFNILFESLTDKLAF